MNISRAEKYIIATFLIVIYLALPIFAHAVYIDEGDISGRVSCGSIYAAPSDECPCSEGHGADCCDTTSCTCSCHAPVSHGLILDYAPEVSSQNFLESSCLLPQGYSSIFVPPQNPL